MKFTARLLGVGFLVGVLVIAARVAHSSIMFSRQIALLQVDSGKDDQAPPCICKQCAGETRCDKSQFAYCECKDGKCVGSCISTPPKQEPFEVAARVVSILERKAITTVDLSQEPNRYSTVLKKVFEGKVYEGRYQLRYNDREIGFSFSKNTISMLNKAVTQMGHPEYVSRIFM